jgi:acetylornithine deacetylase
VKDQSGDTKDPLKAIVEDGKLYGLGSNDAGGCLVSLLKLLCPFMLQKTCLTILLWWLQQKKKAAVKWLKYFKKPSSRMCHCGRTYFDAIGYSRKGLIVLDVKIKGHQVTLHIKMTTMLCTKRFRDGVV